MSNILSSIQPFIDRLAGELSSASIVLLAGLVWSGFVSHRKSRRIDALTDRLFALSEAHIRTAEGMVRAIDENTAAIRAFEQVHWRANGGAGA